MVESGCELYVIRNIILFVCCWANFHDYINLLIRVSCLVTYYQICVYILLYDGLSL